MNPFILLFDFRGRINRAKFWLAALVYIVVLFGVTGVAMAVSGSLTSVIATTLLAYIVLLISAAAVGVKRLHDRNKSAWWLALFAIPVILPFIAALLDWLLQPETSAPFVALQYLSFAISIWALIELGGLRGTIGANRYGNDPLRPAPAVPRSLTRARSPG